MVVSRRASTQTVPFSVPVETASVLAVTGGAVLVGGLLERCHKLISLCVCVLIQEKFIN